MRTKKNTPDLHLLINKAIEFAAKRHEGAYRKGTDIPYIAHPMKVLYLLQKYNQSYVCQIAGICHDLQEDTKTTNAEICELFGVDVGYIVNALTLGKKNGWRKAREDFFDYYANVMNGDASVEAITTEANVWTVKGADIVANLEDLANEYEIKGDKLFEKFNASKEDEAWYYARALFWAYHILNESSSHKDAVKMVSLGFNCYNKVFGFAAYNKYKPTEDERMYNREPWE